MRFAEAARTGVLLGSIVLVTGARADEEKVPLKDVPRVVLDAVRARFPEGEIKDAGKEVEGGKTTYEVAVKDKGHAIDVSLKADGTILEVETEVAAGDLPEAVTAALKAKYPRATIRKAEEVVKFDGGREEKSYEVVLASGGKKTVEVSVSSDG